MDILIKNMEMPKDCRYCPCVRFDKEYGIVSCRAVYDNCNNEDVVARDYDEWDMLDTTQSKPLEKPDWCPLVALPEHGDLIDIDLAIEDFAEKHCRYGACNGKACKDCDYYYVIGFFKTSIRKVVEATE